MEDNQRYYACLYFGLKLNIRVIISFSGLCILKELSSSDLAVMGYSDAKIVDYIDDTGSQIRDLHILKFKNAKYGQLFAYWKTAVGRGKRRENIIKKSIPYTYMNTYTIKKYKLIKYFNLSMIGYANDLTKTIEMCPSFSTDTEAIEYYNLKENLKNFF